MDNLKVIIAGRDVTELVSAVEWSGSYDEVARTLDVSLAVPELDGNLPEAACALGDSVEFYVGDSLRFDGFIFTRRRDTAEDLMELRCYDRGIYLKRNEAAYLFRGVTPEEITRRICADFGIETGTLAETGIPIKRNFPGVPLYGIIQSAYTLAAEQTGEKYLARFRGAALEVIARNQGAETAVLAPGSTLISAAVQESIEDMVNQVAVYDGRGNQVGTYPDAERIGRYGVMQSYLEQAKDRDTAKLAKRMLEDGDAEQRITVENLGGADLIAGECVIVQEPVTGLSGLFWIDADTHTWRDGVYRNRLELNFRKIMDEQQAGWEPEK